MPIVTEYLPGNTSWYIMLLFVAINGAGNSFVQGGMFGFASMFPPKYMSALMVGQGVNGMLLNSVKMMLLSVYPSNESLKDKDMNSFYNSLIFLTVFGLILCTCLV